ncbi:MAG: transporter substrate-binding domain-containing protein, partial [Planktotalea sp.]|uniref:transporter substrate-binding domain-containing protein n=1 Tax=Planktotalea sp. TaxID=2029877 RepID=UPI002636CDDA
MMRIRSIILSALMLFSTFVPESAQANDPLVMATVHRPPFAFADTPELRGFSVDLMRAIGEGIRRKIVFEPQDFFSQMLTKVKTGDVDWAIANISITTERERK